MSRVVKDLLQQVGTDVSGKWISTDKILEFSNLIIDECIRACIADLSDPRDTVELKCAKKIKKHFSVEE
jgi:hypothetical protein